MTPGAAPSASVRPYLLVTVPLALITSALFGWLTTPIDLSVYQNGAQEVLRGGENLYHVTGRAGYQFTYPPFPALLFAPLAWVSFEAAAYLMPLVSFAALIRAVWVLSAPLDRTWAALRPGWLHGRTRAAIGLFTAMLLTEPVYVTFALAQINLILFWLVVEDLAGPRRRMTGLLTGLAMGIKLTPGVFLVYLLLARRWRAAAWCAAGAVATVVIGWLVLPVASRDFWTRALHDPARVGPREFTANQSLNGLVWRFAGPGGSTLAWVALCLVTCVLGILAVRAAHRLEPWTALPLTALVGLLVSPISWDHHWVWGVPAMAAVLVLAPRLGARVSARWVAGAFAFAQAAWTIWWLPFRDGREWQTPLPLRLIYSTYVLAALAVLAWTVLAARRAEEVA